MLGGVSIPSERGAVAHSDGDAALHTVADALLSGLALGDIGQYFPDTAAEWQGMDSRVIVERALALVRGTQIQKPLAEVFDVPRLILD